MSIFERRDQQRGNDDAREMEIVQRLRATYPGCAVHFPTPGSGWTHTQSQTDISQRITVWDMSLQYIGGPPSPHDVYLEFGTQGEYLFDSEKLPPPTRRPRCAAIVAARQVAGLDLIPHWPSTPEDNPDINIIN